MEKWKTFRERSQRFFQYADSFQNRVRKQIKIIKPEEFINFLDYVLSCKLISSTYKIILSLQLTAGGRVSEILKLKKSDILLNERTPIIAISILKKRNKANETRYGAIYPKLIPYLQEHLKDLKGDDLLFSINRFSVLKQYKKMFGCITHALRHSRITYERVIKNKDMFDIVNTYHFSDAKTASRYFNTSTKEEALREFEKAA